MLSDFKLLDAQMASNIVNYDQAASRLQDGSCKVISKSMSDDLNGAGTKATIDLVTPRQLAGYLRLSRATIQRFVSRGVPHERLGTRVYFQIDDVMAWLRDQGLAAQAKRRRAPR